MLRNFQFLYSKIAPNFLKISPVAVKNHVIPNFIQLNSIRQFSLLPSTNLLQNPAISSVSNNTTRNVTKYSLQKGKRKSVKVVLHKFYRLHWGGWIRTICGRHKKLWRKSSARKRRLRQHVFVNGTQRSLLDKMVGPYWRKPKYYVDDPYEPYHTREECQYTYTKPRPYFPPEK